MRSLLLTFLFFLMAPAQALANPVYVLGDSIASTSVWIVKWPHLAWDPYVTNLAVSGSDTFDMVADEAVWLPHAMVGTSWFILIGTNDAARIVNGTNPDGSYALNLAYVVQQLVQAGVDEVHLVSSPSWHSTAGQESVNSLINQQLLLQRDVYDPAICASYPNVFCGPDFYSAMVFPEDFWPDGIHLSDSGHAKGAQLVPEPGSFLMLGSGIIILALLERRRR